MRIVLVVAGTFFVALGVLGALLPVLPTTPFLLLAAACYLRGSRTLYDALHSHRISGTILRAYRDKTGLPLAYKLWTIGALWLSLGFSAFIAVPPRLWIVRLALAGVGIGVTIHVAGIKTRR
jgi:uncharacterized membrane protein YbaN (DUF454 family)